MGRTGGLVQPRVCVCKSVTHTVCIRVSARTSAHTPVPAFVYTRLYTRPCLHRRLSTHTHAPCTSVPIHSPAHASVHAHLCTHLGTSSPAPTAACPQLSTHLHTAGLSQTCTAAHALLTHIRTNACVHTVCNTYQHMSGSARPPTHLCRCVCAQLHAQHAHLHIWHTRALTQQHTALGSTHSPRYISTKEHVTAHISMHSHTSGTHRQLCTHLHTQPHLHAHIHKHRSAAHA